MGEVIGLFIAPVIGKVRVQGFYGMSLKSRALMGQGVVMASSWIEKW